MRHIDLGGLLVPAQGLGCMGMSEGYGRADWDESIRTIRRALDLGVTFLDTADLYGRGHNEVLVGRAIAGRRGEVQLATKFGIDISGGPSARVNRGRAAFVQGSCEASLLRLGVNEIDLYYLHRPPDDADIEETIGAMSDLVRQGKVRHLGLSDVDEPLLWRAHAVHPIAAVQLEYSVFERDAEALAPALAELGVGLVAYAPLGRGVASGTLDLATLPSDDLRVSASRIQEQLAHRGRADITARVAAEARRLDVSPAHVAIGWVGAQGTRLGIPVVPIPGTKRVQHLEENAAASDCWPTLHA